MVVSGTASPNLIFIYEVIPVWGFSLYPPSNPIRKCIQASRIIDECQCIGRIVIPRSGPRCVVLNSGLLITGGAGQRARSGESCW